MMHGARLGEDRDGHPYPGLDLRGILTHEAGNAGLAQLVEQRFCKPKVAGSIPATGTTIPIFACNRGRHNGVAMAE
jgi:hypothetical protein